jgi:hypothetical protein
MSRSRKRGSIHALDFSPLPYVLSYYMCPFTRLILLCFFLLSSLRKHQFFNHNLPHKILTYLPRIKSSSFHFFGFRNNNCFLQSKVVSLSWNPQPGGPGSCIYVPQEQGGSVIPPGLLRLAGLRWRHSNPPPRGTLDVIRRRVQDMKLLTTLSHLPLLLLFCRNILLGASFEITTIRVISLWLQKAEFHIKKNTTEH